MVGDVVVDVAVRRGPFGGPVVAMVPVGLGEVESRPKALGTEGVDEVEGDVGLRVAAVGAVDTRHAIVGFGTAEHAETVVVLGGEDHILHAGVLGSGGHGCGVEPGGVESFVEGLVAVFVFLVGHAFAVNPGLATDAPGFDYTPLGVDAPMHHEAKFEVLPLVDAVKDDGIGFGVTVRLCGSHAAEGGKGEGEDEGLLHRVSVLNDKWGAVHLV